MITEKCAVETEPYLKELEGLGHYLDDIGYADFINSYPNMPYAFAECPSFLMRTRSMMTHDLRTAIRLFALGEAVDSSAIDSTGLCRFVPALLAGDVLCEASSSCLRTQNLMCQVVDGCYLFVTMDGRKGEFPAYFGDDSLKLTRHLVGHPGQRAMDVCCGSGIQSILLARRGLSVTGVDIQAKAINLARINSVINGVSGLAKFVNADINEYRPSEQVDVIVSNPPLLPIASGLKYSIVGDGGESGLLITQEIISRLYEFGTENVRGAIVGTCLGTEDDCELAEWLRSCTFLNTSFSLLLSSQISVAKANESIAYTSHIQYGEPLHRALDGMNKMCAKRSATHFYSFVLRFCPNPAGLKVRMFPLYQKGVSAGWYVK